MLVVQRFPDERILIDFRGASDADIARLRAGEPIQVMLVDIRGDRTRIGVAGPKSVAFTRMEIADETLRDAALAAEPGIARKVGVA